MAILEATPASVSSVVNRTIRGDVVKLLGGKYGPLPTKSGIIFEAVDYDPLRVVRDTTGHFGQGMPVWIEGIENTPEDDVVVRGVVYDARPFTSINAHLIGGNNVRMEGCVCLDRNSSRKIGITLGTGTDRQMGFAFINGRYHFSGLPGVVKDQTYYIKNSTAWEIGGSLLYDGGQYAIHLYTNGDSGRIHTSVIWGFGLGVTFSGGSDSSTGTSEYGTSDDNMVDHNIIGHGRATSGYLIESWTSDPSRPVKGNKVYDNIITKGGGNAGLVKPNIAGVDLQRNVDRDPGFADWRNGDFRRKGSYDGFGPAALFGTVAPPPPPPPPPGPTRDELVVGDFSAIKGRLDRVESYMNLTPDQRTRIIEARNRAGIGLARFA